MGVNWRKSFYGILSRIHGTKKNPKTRLTQGITPAPFPTFVNKTYPGSDKARSSVAPPSSMSEVSTPRAETGSGPDVSSNPVIINNIGIDFGTSFTKVGYRDVGAEESGIVTFDAGVASGAMIPSIVSVDPSGNLSLGELGTGNDVTIVRYLKMRLAGLSADGPLPVFDGVDLNDTGVIRALSSWFLATVISRARDWIHIHETERFIGRKPQWSANVGLPVEHYDSQTIGVFQTALAVAWDWATHDDVPSRLDELLAKYRETAPSVDPATTDCHAIPEMAAAVQSFITSREAAPGIYVYFDIGGGTVDGVAFYYMNRDGERRVNFYSGKVAALGVEILTARLRTAGIALPNNALMNKETSDAVQLVLAPFGNCIQKLVAHIVMTAKTKDNPWIRRPCPPGLLPSDPSTVPPLPVFVGGGGAGSEWYRERILSTHKDFQHWNVGIPPYKLTELPKPSDLRMNGLGDNLFRRFAVAYGLSIPHPEFGLPSEFPPHPRQQSIPSPQGGSTVDYLDSKDAYD